MPAPGRSCRVVAALGGGLVLAAVLLSGPTIEAAFGRAQGSLRWGPTLFRALLGFHGLLLIVASCRRRHAAIPAGAPRPLGPTTVGERFAIGGICLIALILRSIKLDSGLWYDEIITVLDWIRAPLGVTLTSLPNQNNHILFSALAKIAVTVLGESAWSVRLPSVFFGVGSVWALFMFGRRVVGSREALLASAVLAVSYHHIWFSQNARGYSGLLFFSIVTTWIWMEALPRTSLRRWVGYAVAVSLGMWVHLTMAFVVASHAVVYLAVEARALLRRRRNVEGDARRTNWLPLTGFLLGVTLTLQLHALPLPQFLSSGLHEVSLPSAWVNPLWLLVETARGFVSGFAGGRIWLGAALLLAGAWIGLSGWIGILRRQGRVAFVMVLPGVLLVGLMVALRHNLWPRFLFFCAGFAVLIVVHGAFVASGHVVRILARGAHREGATRACGLVLTGLMVAVSLASLPRYYSLPKQDYAGAIAWVQGNVGPDEEVVTGGLAATAFLEYYGSRWRRVESAADLENVRASSRRVWFVYTLPVHLRSYHADLWAALDRDFETVRVFSGTLSGGEVYVCRERSEPR